MKRLCRLAGCACISAWIALPAPAAQPYPERPVRLVVGFPPGGAADIIARIVGQKVADAWGQQVVVDNRPGAGSTLGAAIVASAAPDGYTLLMISSSHAASAGLYRTAYQPVESFAPVILLASAPQALLATPALPVQSIQELLAAARAQPGRYSYGSAGNGSTTHLAGELLSGMAGVKLLHVPYKGGAPALADLIGGQIHLTFLTLPPALPQIRAGKVRALAVTSARRAPALPQVAAVAEAVPGYEAANWYGVLAPARTPAPILGRLNAALAEAVRDRAVAGNIESQGADIVGSGPEAFTDYLRAEVRKWTAVIESAGLRAANR